MLERQKHDMNLKEFTQEVDRISTEKYGLPYTSENGEDCPELAQAFEDGETPEEFVEWWADKYELTAL